MQCRVSAGLLQVTCVREGTRLATGETFALGHGCPYGAKQSLLLRPAFVPLDGDDSGHRRHVRPRACCLTAPSYGEPEDDPLSPLERLMISVALHGAGEDG
jgi:hypothetical protein